MGASAERSAGGAARRTGQAACRAHHSQLALYNCNGWGNPYFSVNDAGHLVVRPKGDEREVDVFELVQALSARGLRTPVMLRFLDIVGDRIERLHKAFAGAIERFEYKGTYRGVFPVKCNHDRDLIGCMVRHGAPFGFGLEVGSKAELAMVMAVLADSPGANLICNGYKDAEYMEMVLHCRELGINAMVVMEQYSELGTLLDCAKRLGVRPGIGIRAKLTTQHRGHWGSTSGDKAKFGLKAREVVAVVNRLRREKMLDCLQLLHFHSGSQITSIREVKEVMRESSFLYAELVKMGAGMKYIDVGGGLAVDYDGSFTDTPASMSYTLQNYANDVVSAMQEVCIQRGIAPPTIISESGRALASHHSVLVFDAARGGKGQFLLTTFKEVYGNIQPDDSSLREAFTDATYFKDEALRAFKLGILSLDERAQIDTMYDATCQRISEVAEENGLPVPDALRPTSIPGPKQLYHVNLSVFRSTVDVWGISQVFPIMPVHRLEEEPTVMATLADLTCDSDGKIDKFINPEGGDPMPALPLHEVQEGEKYYLAMFMTGVYQEVMGSLHNMGETVAEVLARAHHHKNTMLHAVKAAADAAAAEGRLAADAAERLTTNYTNRLMGYTWVAFCHIVALFLAC
ncbi:MAG: arginine decarboxylase [Monoraphidium minutum]|nr:MAG: arginine decarboxylase [Monoraphidium minutum]